MKWQMHFIHRLFAIHFFVPGDETNRRLVEVHSLSWTTLRDNQSVHYRCRIPH